MQRVCSFYSVSCGCVPHQIVPFYQLHGVVIIVDGSSLCPSKCSVIRDILQRILTTPPACQTRYHFSFYPSPSFSSHTCCFSLPVPFSASGWTVRRRWTTLGSSLRLSSCTPTSVTWSRTVPPLTSPPCWTSTVPTLPWPTRIPLHNALLCRSVGDAGGRQSPLEERTVARPVVLCHGRKRSHTRFLPGSSP
jgi:hypothetical protein